MRPQISLKLKQGLMVRSYGDVTEALKQLQRSARQTVGPLGITDNDHTTVSGHGGETETEIPDNVSGNTFLINPAPLSAQRERQSLRIVQLLSCLIRG